MGRTITLEAAGRSFVFRIPQGRHLVRIFGQLPVLPDAEGTGKKQTATARESVVEQYKLAERLLVELSVTPKIVEEFTPDPVDGIVSIEEIADDDLVRMSEAILKEGGFHRAAAEEVAPLSAAESVS